MSIKRILEYEMLKRGMTQVEFAKFLEVPRGTLSHHLTGRNISPRILKRYSDKLDVDLADIYVRRNMDE